MAKGQLGEKHPRARLTEDDVLAIRGRRAAGRERRGHSRRVRRRQVHSLLDNSRGDLDACRRRANSRDGYHVRRRNAVPALVKGRAGERHCGVVRR